MNRIPPWLWFSLLIIFVLPTSAGRIFFDVAGGLMLIFLALPFLIAGAGWIGWRVVKSRMKTCNTCGMISLGNTLICPSCGSQLSDISNLEKSQEQDNSNVPASSATIDITPNKENNA